MSKKLIAIVAAAIITTQVLGTALEANATTKQKNEGVKVEEVKAAPTITLRAKEVFVEPGEITNVYGVSDLATAKSATGETINPTYKADGADFTKVGKIDVIVTAKDKTTQVEAKETIVVNVVAKGDKRLNPTLKLTNKTINPKTTGSLRDLVIVEAKNNLYRDIKGSTNFEINGKKVNERTIPQKPGVYKVKATLKDNKGRITTQECTLTVSGKLHAPVIVLTDKEVTVKASMNIDLTKYVKSVTDEEDGDLRGKVRFLVDGKEAMSMELKIGENKVIFTVVDSDGMRTNATLIVNVVEDGEDSKPTNPEKPVKPTPEKPVKPTPEKPIKPTPEKPVKPTPEKPVKPTPEKPAKPESKPGTDKPSTGDVGSLGLLFAGVVSTGAVLKLKKRK